jgi:thymidylate synthase
MSKADIIFRDMCNNIIAHGTDTRGENVRPIWTDTKEKAYTIKLFGQTAMYDLREEFPALTFRRTAIKSAVNEILWIFQKKSNNIKDLKPHIWDEWADEYGSIGHAYGYQIGQRFIHHSIDSETPKDEYTKLQSMFPSYTEAPKFNPNTGIFNRDGSMNVLMDQMDAVLYELKYTPYSRRILTSIYNHKELYMMNLHPCCWNCTFNVTDEGYDKLILNMVLNQRSNDVLAANNWNVVQYSALLMMVAQSVNMIPGKLLHVITDAHIYDRHVPLVQELITRPMYDAPSVTLNPDIKNFYDFTEDDFIVENYQHGEQIKNIPIAV